MRTSHHTRLAALLLLSATAQPLVARVAFASCNRHWYPDQEVWGGIRSFRPDLFLWTGDAVYVKNVTALPAAFAALQQLEGYQKALASALVDGVYDDHDYGSNDAGKSWSGREAAQTAYLDFLGASVQDPRRQQEGIYGAKTYRYTQRTTETHSGIFKTVLLDTRFHRDSHLPPSVGGVLWLPLAPLFASSVRVLSVVLGLTQLNSGDVLGETQWSWLQAQLCNSTADAHLLVSSIQVTTTNPFLESWGQLPAARQRLLSLLRTCNPAGLRLISGDVHFAELLGDGESLIEVTSSGMTHTCSSDPSPGGFAVGLVCKLLLWLFGHNRMGGEAFTEFNFGSVEISADPPVGIEPCETNSGPWLNVSIRNRLGLAVLSDAGCAETGSTITTRSKFENLHKLESSRMVWLLRVVICAISLLITICLARRFQFYGFVKRIKYE